MTKPSQTVRSLWNMICPSCKEDDALDVQVHVLARLSTSGTDTDAASDGSHEWDSSSRIRCGACHWAGTVADTEAACAANPEKVRERRSFTPAEIDAALCAWEHMIDQSDNPLYAPFFEALGYSAMRACSIQAGLIVDAVYQQMQTEDYEFDAPFDWEFVPAVLTRLDWKALTEDNQFSGAPYRPDIEALLDAMIEAAPDFFAKTDPDAVWMATARRECIKQWRYQELLDDHPERVTAAREAGASPADVVRDLGEKYGLTPASDW